MSAWYLIQCKPRSESRAEFNLNNQGFECFLPRRQVERKNAAGLRSSMEPLFPGYLFLYLGEHSNWGVIRSTRGVARIVGFTGTPTPVPERIIAGLKQHCHVLQESGPQSYCKPGDKALITEGCFKDLEAVVQAVNGEERVVLLLNLLNRSQAVEVPLSSVRRVS